jgi:hypothetical protein
LFDIDDIKSIKFICAKPPKFLPFFLSHFLKLFNCILITMISGTIIVDNQEKTIQRVHL